MALTDYVIMPGEDYQAICDAVREKRNEIEVIKSGEIAGKIQGIEVKPVLQDKTVTPAAEVQIVTADEGYNGLGTVTVEAVEMVDELARIIGEAKINMLHEESRYYFPVNGGTSSLSATPSSNNMFYNCYSLTTVPLFDTSKVTSMTSMFYNCFSLTTVPLFDTSKVTNMSDMFVCCGSLITVPLFDTSKVTNMYRIFYNCFSLTTVPLFDTSKVTNMYGMFFNCHSLTTVPLLDMRNATSVSSMFYNCNSLTDCYLRNIKVSLQVGAGTSYGHLLTLDSLIHLIKECRDTGSQKTLTIGSANLEKIANIYVRLIDITDEMRAEDDLIDEKLPFEVCESTDEGAMLITDYAAEKNWAIA